VTKPLSLGTETVDFGLLAGSVFLDAMKVSDAW